jgi:pimeloyl-ACP methyl ester carboxylesterase
VRAADALSPKERLLLDGVELAYLSVGPATGRSVLWIHGFPRNAYVWRGCLGPMAEAGYRCLAPDLAGLGESEGPQAGDFGPRAQARRLATFLDRVGAGSVRVVTEGVGAIFALALAAERPEAVKGLALLDPDFVIRPGSPGRLAGALARSGFGGIVLGSLRARRFVSRLELAPRPRGSVLERTGDLYLRPILAEPQSRGRAVAFLSGLSPAQAAEVYRDIVRGPRPPVLLCLSPWEEGGEIGAGEGTLVETTPPADRAEAGASESAAEEVLERQPIPGSCVLTLRERPLTLLERNPEEVVRILMPFLSALSD